jgi:hypothetical protein
LNAETNSSGASMSTSCARGPEAGIAHNALLRGPVDRPGGTSAPT